MEKKSVKEIYGLIQAFLIIFLLSINVCLGAANNQPLSTEILQLNWMKINSGLPVENYTNFKLKVNFVISNPNSEAKTITFPYKGMYYNINASIAFDEFNYNFGILINHSFCPEIDQRTYQPGITQDNTSNILAIKEPGLTTLPDGVYNLTVYGYLVQGMNWNQTTFTIKDGEVYDPTEAVSMISTRFLVLGLTLNVLIIFIINKKKHYRGNPYSHK
ncbi:MAG: hypothetical protein GF308_10845 [Candidatus Heimdallarchaeota archaeon]|nr:hypothetical protein [Candidatus Heimdallarchaeota archaeon]